MAYQVMDDRGGVSQVRNQRKTKYKCFRLMPKVLARQHGCGCASEPQSDRRFSAFSGSIGPAAVAVIGVLTGMIALSACGEANTPVAQHGNARTSDFTTRVVRVRSNPVPTRRRRLRRPVRCKTGQLTISIGSTQGGLGHFGSILRFKDRGARCEMRGYPGVAGLTRGGKQVVEARRTPTGYLGGSVPGRAMRTVLLSRGQTGSALLEGRLGPTPGGPRCPSYNALLVTPPNDTHSVKIRSPFGLCYLEIHPILPGRLGGANPL